MLNITKANLMENIAELEKLGFKRWTKNGMDRMYINAGKLGYDKETRTFLGERISGGRAGQMESAKTYIDMIEYKIISTDCDLAYEAAKKLGIDPVGGICKYEIK